MKKMYYYIKDLCCICLTHDKHLQRLHKDSCGNKIYSNLTTSVPEMVSSILDEHVMVCSQCRTKLETVHRFREQCLRNKHFLTDYISKLHSISETRGVLNVRMKDFKYMIKDSVQNLEQFKNLYHKKDDLIVKTTSGYIVTNNTSVNYSDNIDPIVEIETNKNEYPAGNGSNAERGYKGLSDDMLHNDIAVKVVKEEPDPTTEYQYDAKYEITTISSYTTERQTGNGNTSLTAIGDIPGYNTHSNDIIKEELIIKSEHEDLSEYETFSEENKPDNELNDTIGMYSAAVTEDMSRININTSRTVMEETDMKFEHENLSAEEKYNDENEQEGTDQDDGNSNTSLTAVEDIPGYNIYSNDIIKEELIIKSEHEDLSEYKTFSEENKPDNELNGSTGMYSAAVTEDMSRININTSRTVMVETDVKFEHENLSAEEKYNDENEQESTDQDDVTDISSDKSLGKNQLRKVQSCNKEQAATKKYGMYHESFLFTSKLVRDKLTPTGENKFSCDQCNKAFSHPWHLTMHGQMHPGEKPYKCDQCDIAFYNMSDLTVHKRIHTGEKPHKCDQCNKAFSHPSYLTVHKRRHTGEKPFKCQQCPKTFIQSSYLTVHTRTHTGEKPFKCQQCPKAFISSSCLTVHKRTHTGEKPFKCQQCPKAFVQSSDLTVHKRMHTGEKPYKCDQCNKAFSHHSYLTVHKRMHTAEKPYKCDQCNKAFSLHSYLTVHKRTHTGEKPYKCEICNKGFAQSTNLKRHKRTHIA